MKIKNLLLLFIIYYLLFAVFVPLDVLAQEGLVPCGTSTTPPCNICHIFTLLQNILNFLWWYISIPLATLMLAYAGFLLMIPSLGSGSPPMITKGKKVLKNTVVGIIIVFFSWLFIDTIIKVIAGQELGSGNPAEIGGYGPWNEVRCDASFSASLPERNNSAVAVEGSSKTATLKPNTREQLVALTSFLLQQDPVFAGEVEKLLKEAESSPASRKFFLEINGTNPAPSIIIWKEITWINKVIQLAQIFFPVVKAASVSISSVTPKEATPGSTVVIKGAGFSPTDNTFNLTFPDGTVAIYNDIPSQDNGTIIQGVVPQTIIIGGKYTFFISNENGLSNTATLDIIVNPAIFIVNQMEIGILGEGLLGSNKVTVTDNGSAIVSISLSLGNSSLSANVDPDGNLTGVTAPSLGNDPGLSASTLAGLSIDQSNLAQEASNNAINSASRGDFSGANKSYGEAVGRADYAQALANRAGEIADRGNDASAKGDARDAKIAADRALNDARQTRDAINAAQRVSPVPEEEPIPPEVTPPEVDLNDALSGPPNSTSPNPSEVDTSVPDAPTPDGSTPDGPGPDGTPDF